MKDQTVTATEVKSLDMVGPYELLVLFRDYVDQCIEDYNSAKWTRPLSFDEWYVREYTTNIESLTTVIRLDKRIGDITKSYDCRIPANLVTGPNGGIVDLAGLKKLARRLTISLMDAP